MSRPRRRGWERLLKRVFDIDMQHDSDCGGGQIGSEAKRS